MMDAIDDMIRRQIVARGVADPDVLHAMHAVRRELFVPPAMRGNAYTDQPLAIGHDQTISQPYMVAMMTEALQLTALHRVLEIDTGSGYQTAILARIAAHVYTIERVTELLDQARERLAQLGITNVSYRAGDGTLGWPEQAPFDRILVTAAAPHIPGNLLQSQLADGGVAIIPVGRYEVQDLLRIRRKGGDLLEEDLGGCRFVPLIGKEGWPE